MAWLRLVRWSNLLIVALTQFVAWWCVIRPHRQPAMVLSPGHFLLLCLSTVLIAAGGYIINDYFDIRIDAINKPEKVILERDIPRRLAIIIHSVLNIIAMIFAAIVAVPAGHPEWLLLQLCCAAMLWRYSTNWKRQFMIGNVVVAFMTALTIIVLIIYEPVMQFYLGRLAFFQPAVRFSSVVPNPAYVLCIFAAFAFLLTWMREIVKDMEDFKGDDAEGCMTMPIRWGLLRSTRFVQMLGLISVLLLAAASVRLWREENFLSISAMEIAMTLIVPLLIWIFKLPAAATSLHYHRSSTRLKLIMVAGIVSLLFLHFIHYA